MLNLGVKKVVGFLNIKCFLKFIIILFYFKNLSVLNIVLVSMYEGEEELGLKVFLELKKIFKNVRFFVVLRYFECFKSV